MMTAISQQSNQNCRLPSVRRGELLLVGGLLASLSLCMVAPLSAQTLETVEETPIDEIDRDYWSFQPIGQFDPPQVVRQNWCRTPIDHFILAELERQDLAPVPEADRITLIRRLTYDLTGLPPTPEEVTAFCADRSDDAYEKLVNRLLDSPAYGERWSRHWLDLARYAESDGFEHDKLRPQAWRYRDWVISALNRDLPFDEFLTHQLAGDELYPDDPQAVVATGFLLCGPDMTDINLIEERRHNFLNVTASTVGEVFLGLQFGCAQCHDHKSDPISIHDFYRLRAFFDSLDLFRDHELPLPVSNPEDVPKGRVARNGSQEIESFVRVKGDFRRQGPQIFPAAPRIATLDEMPNEVATRTELARWLTDHRNPLTARVIVNRIWQQHFGVGICPTTSDFGLMGEYPSHPELLDWLAQWFMDNGWRMKDLHRLLVTSSVYRSDSRPASDPDAWARLAEEDPDNQLLGRMSRRRLDAEEIRDAMLFVSGQLNRDVGGESVRPPLPPEVLQSKGPTKWEASENERDHVRRSIYLLATRNLRFPLLEAFDLPDTNQSCSRRTRTTIAPQALHLLNSDFAITCARQAAARVTHEAPSAEEQIRLLFHIALGRPPSASELREAHRFLAPAEPESMQDLCLAILNLNEFVYVD